MSHLNVPGGAMTRSTVFRSKRNQAVRVPRAIASPEDVRQIDAIPPVGRSWSDFFLNGPGVSDDFIIERDDPPPEEREPL